MQDEPTDVNDARFRIVAREHSLHIRRTLDRDTLLRHQRDRPALAAAVGRRRTLLHAEEVAIRRERDIRAARTGQAVPLPEPGVDLDQLEDAVARIALPFDLRDAVETE